MRRYVFLLTVVSVPFCNQPQIGVRLFLRLINIINNILNGYRMEQKTNDWLSPDSRIEPPPKREWYGDEAHRALLYAEHIRINRRNIDKHYPAAIGIPASIAGIAWGVAAHIYACHIDSAMFLICGIALAPFVGVACGFLLTEVFARGMAYDDFLRQPRKSKPLFKQTFKFGKQNGSK